MKNAVKALESSKLGSLEIGRFLAALAVMVSHLNAIVNVYAAQPGTKILHGFIGPGPFGLQYFFTLSGFVMASAHYQDFGKFSAIPRFWWRRACRIYPVYWLALGIPLFFFYGGLKLSFYPQLLTLEPWDKRDLIPAAWSLRYEISFYIMFGLCLAPYIGKPLLAGWIFVTFWRWCPQSVLPYLHLPIPFVLNNLAGELGTDFVAFFEFFFFAGLLGGWAHKALRPNVAMSWALTIAGTVILMATMPVRHWGLEYGPPMFMIGTGLMLSSIMLGLAGLERHNVLRLGKKAAMLGMISYPLYMIHEPIMLLVQIKTPHLRLNLPGMYLLALVWFLAFFVAAVLIAFYYDRPIQRALRRIKLVRA